MPVLKGFDKDKYNKIIIKWNSQPRWDLAAPIIARGMKS